MQEKIKRRAQRLKQFSYNNAGHYFVTINTKHNFPYFGNINCYKLQLNNIGIIVDLQWNNIPMHYNNVIIDEYIIMPNHLHGIVIITKTVGNRLACSANKTNRNIELLPKVIGSFKAGVSREVRKIVPEFYWQKSYYDHIIRNEKSLEKIREYICFNHLKESRNR